MWVLATRSRPSNCARFIQLWHDTAASTPVYLRLDLCDPDLSQLTALPWPKQFTVVVGPRARLTAACNEMFEVHPNEPWYGLLADDLIPGSPHWDQLLATAAAPNRISYAPDQTALKYNRFSMSHPCVGGDLVRLVGYFGPTVLQHFGISTFWQTIHHQLGWDGAVPDAVLDHAHPAYSKADMDDTYRSSQANKQDDLVKLKLFMDANLQKILDRIKQEL